MGPIIFFQDTTHLSTPTSNNSHRANKITADETGFPHIELVQKDYYPEISSNIIVIKWVGTILGGNKDLTFEAKNFHLLQVHTFFMLEVFVYCLKEVEI